MPTVKTHSGLQLAAQRWDYSQSHMNKNRAIDGYLVVLQLIEMIVINWLGMGMGMQ